MTFLNPTEMEAVVERTKIEMVKIMDDADGDAVNMNAQVPADENQDMQEGGMCFNCFNTNK